MAKRNRIICCALALFFVLLAAFLVRALPASLPSVPEGIRDEYLDEDGIPYLTEMDSYFYLRFATEMAESGEAFLYNKRGEDPLMGQRSRADSGQGLPIFLSTLAYYLWRFLSLFWQVSVLRIARWMGPVFGSLAAVPAFLYVKRRTNLAGGIAAALLAGLSIPFVSHTHAGFFDTDMMLAVLPLGFVLLQLRAMQERTLRRQAVCGVCGGLLLALLALIWASFFTYYWLMVLGGLLGVLLVAAFAFRVPWRRRLLVIRGWLFSILPALFFVLVFRGIPGLETLGEIFSTFRSVSGLTSAFPFMFQYTGEMQPLAFLPESGGLAALLRADNASGVGSMGGLTACLLAAAGFPLALLAARRKHTPEDRENNRDALIAALTEAGILFLWLAFGVVLMRTKRRFTEIAVLPAAVLAGLAVGFIVRLVRGRKNRDGQPDRKAWRKWLCIPVSAVLIAGCCLPAGIGAADLARAALPSVTDSMNSTMAWIRENTTEDTAIASWWDYGYFMQYRARRRTIADGGTSYGEKVFCFLGKALLTEDPARMTGILRMLEASSFTAVDELVRCGATEAEAVEYLLRIVLLSREEAAMEKPPAEMTEEAFSALLDRVWPEEKKPLLLVLSEDVLNKTDAVSYFGFWDVNTLEQAEESYCLRTAETAELTAGEEAGFTVRGTTLVLKVRKDPIGLVQASLELDGETFSPGRICCWKDGEKTQDLVFSGEGPAVVLAEREGRTSALVCSQNLCNSMLIRLLFCQDRTVEGVTLLGTRESPLVQVWEVKE